MPRGTETRTRTETGTRFADGNRDAIRIDRAEKQTASVNRKGPPTLWYAGKEQRGLSTFHNVSQDFARLNGRTLRILANTGDSHQEEGGGPQRPQCPRG